MSTNSTKQDRLSWERIKHHLICIREHLNWHIAGIVREFKLMKIVKPNGCSFVWDGPNGKWKKFCDLHDLDYAQGGTEKDRKKSDRKLRNRIIKSGNPFFGWIYYAGVRMLGWLFFKYKR